MGLAQPKKKVKISADPNNSRWSKDTSRFGQKILRAQGWEPGQYLGAQDAAHAAHYTEANATGIRVAIKDDNLGLGFKRSKEDEITGLDVFQDLLGRLNGKSEDAIDTDRKARLAVKAVLYADQRFGPMRFVKGGFLVGDKVVENDTDASAEEAASIKIEVDSTADVSSADNDGKKSKKRKGEEELAGESAEEKALRKKRRKEEKKAAKKAKALDTDAPDSESNVTPVEMAVDSTEMETEQRSKRRKEKGSDETATRAERKAAKKAKKKDRREKLGDTDSSTEQLPERKKNQKSGPEESAESPKLVELSKESATSTPSETKESTPIRTGSSTPQGVNSGRHLARSRFIAQKRQAFLDVKALNQIFMVKQ